MKNRVRRIRGNGNVVCQFVMVGNSRCAQDAGNFDAPLCLQSHFALTIKDGGRF